MGVASKGNGENTGRQVSGAPQIKISGIILVPAKAW